MKSLCFGVRSCGWAGSQVELRRNGKLWHATSLFALNCVPYRKFTTTLACSVGGFANSEKALQKISGIIIWLCRSNLFIDYEELLECNSTGNFMKTLSWLKFHITNCTTSDPQYLCRKWEQSCGRVQSQFAPSIFNVGRYYTFGRLGFMRNLGAILKMQLGLSGKSKIAHRMQVFCSDKDY